MLEECVAHPGHHVRAPTGWKEDSDNGTGIWWKNHLIVIVVICMTVNQLIYLGPVLVQDVQNGAALHLQGVHAGTLSVEEGC